MQFQIALEDPAKPDVIALLEAGDAYGASLYPAESNHFLAVTDEQDVPHDHRVVPGFSIQRRDLRELLVLVGRCAHQCNLTFL